MNPSAVYQDTSEEFPRSLNNYVKMAKRLSEDSFPWTSYPGCLPVHLTRLERPLEADRLQVDVTCCFVTKTPIVSPAKSQKCLLQLNSNLFP